MTRKNTPAKGPRKTRAKAPAKPKTPAAAPAKTPEQLAVLVEPLAPNALKLVLGIIDNATIKGSEANLVIQLKIELARVAGVKKSGQ